MGDAGREVPLTNKLSGAADVVVKERVQVRERGCPVACFPVRFFGFRALGFPASMCMRARSLVQGTL